MTDQPSGFVILHYGSMTSEAISKAVELLGDGAVIDFDTARMAGSTFAFGAPELLEELDDRLAPGARKKVQSKYPHLEANVANWLATGERGLSADAILAHITGADVFDGQEPPIDHPLDPGDLRCCRLLVEQVPEIYSSLRAMWQVSPEWEAIMDVWSDLCIDMDVESPHWREKIGSAPQTARRLQGALDKAKGSQAQGS